MAWALAATGRTARAARRLLLERQDLGHVLSLTVREAVAIAREPEQAVVPLLEPSLTPGVNEQLDRLGRSGARLIGLLDAEYPPLLRQITDPPVFLFARGERLSGGDAVALVGSRNPSRTGLETARLLARALAREGVDVVSGFARGIDGAAHRAALEAGGRTTAVLGSGVDVCYPPEHASLVPAMLRGGTLVSEFPMGTRPKPHHFPVRNRLIAGLVPLVVVVEAAERSGSLITARHAADFGRDVAAVPGAILNEQSAGSNSLLKDGAILIRSPRDMFAELPAAAGRTRAPLPDSDAPAGGSAAPPSLDPDALALLAALHPDDPRDADDLVASTGLSPARLSAALVLLEMEGLASSLPGAAFVRRRRGG